MDDRIRYFERERSDLLAEHGYPPVDRDEVYKEIFEQAENFKKYQGRVGV
jgi:hypothetical protein